MLKVFVDLYDKGLIYRDNYMVNWDPGSRSAISDLEVEEREVTDTLYYDRLPARVRPRLAHDRHRAARRRCSADTAIAVHPDDERYTRLVGETAILPLVGRRLRIIADPYVKPEFGTGALKITPGHDPNDFEIGRAHGLEEISVIGEDGRMTAAAGERFAGMTALEAREAVVAALREEGRIARTEPLLAQRAVLAPLGRADRAADLAAVVHAHGRARRAGDRGGARRAASRSTRSASARRYLEWMENIRPWCISRQLWWGHQIPVWYRGEETYVGHRAARGRGLGARPRRARHLVLERAVAVRDARLARATRPELRAFYPTDVLSTARDILFLWVARMVMMGLEFTGEIPFSRRLRATRSSRRPTGAGCRSRSAPASTR